MPDLFVGNIPHDLYERLRQYALESNLCVNDVVLSAIERELERSDWQKRLAQRPKTDLSVSVLTLLAEERRLRDTELGKRSSLHDH